MFVPHLSLTEVPIYIPVESGSLLDTEIGASATSTSTLVC